MTSELDIAGARAIRNYSNRAMSLRIAWMLGEWLVRFSPRPCFRWRSWVLGRFGAEVASNVHVYPSARIYFPWNLTVGVWSSIADEVLVYNLGRVTIGRKVTISHGAHLCAGTHDYHRIDLPLLKPPIQIHDQAWICAEAFVGPGVVVGPGAVVGARAVVTKDVPPWTVVAGNPARPIGRRNLMDCPTSESRATT